MTEQEQQEQEHENKRIRPRERALGQKSGQKFFVCFLVQMKTTKSPFEIN